MNLNKFFATLLTTLSFGTATLLADIDVSDYGSEKIDQPARNVPFNLQVDFDAIGASKIRNKGWFKNDEVHFAEADAQLGFVYYYCPAYEEGANVAVSYTYTKLKWDENPWFHQKHFDTVSVYLGFFSKRLHRWFWQGQIDMNLDAQVWNINEYATYDLLLWGRYEYTGDIGIHIGLIAQTGMQMDRVYPILGADWRVSKNWKLNMVFPVNVSLEYAINNNWTVALAGRSFDSRHRAHGHGGQRKSVFRYENVGAEFAIKYAIRDMYINVHAGSTLGGRLRIANRHNNHSHRYRLDPAGYAGAEVNVRF